MIRFVQSEEEKRALLRLCEKTAFGCKISTIARAYGFDKSFACFWLDWDENVVYCLVDGVMLLSGTVLDGEGSRQFLHMVGAGEILCAVRNAEALKLKPLAKGDVLKRKVEPGPVPSMPSASVNIREIYALLSQEGMVGEFEPFYLDLSHKLRHQAACALTVPWKDGICGCAVVSSIQKDQQFCRRWQCKRSIVATVWEQNLSVRWRAIFLEKPCMCSGNRIRIENFIGAWAM